MNYRSLFVMMAVVWGGMLATPAGAVCPNAGCPEDFFPLGAATNLNLSCPVGFQQSTFASGFNPGSACLGGVGPTGMAALPSGEVLINHLPAGQIFRHSAAPACNPGVAFGPVFGSGRPVGLVLSLTGRIYEGLQGPGQLIGLDATGTPIAGESYSPASLYVADMVRDNRTNVLYLNVSGFGGMDGIVKFTPGAPGAGTFTPLATGAPFSNPNGLTGGLFMLDGVQEFILFASNRATGDITATDAATGATVVVVAALPGQPDGGALGRVGSCSDGFLFINRNTLGVTVIDLRGITTFAGLALPAELSTEDDLDRVRVFAAGWSRGDIVKVLPATPSTLQNDTAFKMLLTGTDRVQLVGPAIFAPSAGSSVSPSDLLEYVNAQIAAGCIGEPAGGGGGGGGGVGGILTGLTNHLDNAAHGFEQGGGGVPGVCNQLDAVIRFVNDNPGAFTCAGVADTIRDSATFMKSSLGCP